MPLNFPDSPSVNDTHSDGGRSWTWNGTTWVLNTYVGVVPAGAVGTTELAANSVTSAKIVDDTIVNADINSSAAIAYSKLALSNTIVNADINSSAAIDLNKLADTSTSAQVASYTLVLADKNKLVEMNVGSANNLTVPLNSNHAFPVGSQIHVLQTGSGQTTIVPTGGVTVNATPGLKLRAQWSSATLIKRGTDTWVLIGDLSA